MGPEFPRISLCPRLAGLLRLFLVSGRPSIVIRGDKELLAVAGAVSQLISFPNVFCAGLRFTHGTVCEAQRRICNCKAGVDLDSMLEKRNSGVPARRGCNFPAHAISLEGLQ